MSQASPPRRSVVAGVARIAIGRGDGLQHFGGTPQAFLSSLAPLLALPIAGAIIGFISGDAREAALNLAMALVAMLTPAVVSYELARLWKRGEQWLRFATAFNWCEWILPVLACVLILPVSGAVGLGFSPDIAAMAMLLCLAAYGLWLHWFLARKALSLTGGRAALLVLVVNFVTATAVTVPMLLASDVG